MSANVTETSTEVVEELARGLLALSAEAKIRYARVPAFIRGQSTIDELNASKVLADAANVLLAIGGGNASCERMYQQLTAKKTK